MFDHETIFQWVLKKEWESLLNFVHKNPEAASSDELIQTAIQTFVQQMVADIDANSQNQQFAWYLEKVILLRQMGKFRISEEHYHAIVVELVKRKQNNITDAYNYAILFPNDEVCASVIQRHSASTSQRVQHSQADRIQVRSNSGIADVDYTIPLFKSQQEHQFYRAVVELFPNHAVYPNVALSCLIDFRQMESHLSTDERRYFFSGIVDCVVFDIFKAHKPIRFFELDSIYHDSERQSSRDTHKDRILALAGQRLYRIRKKSPQVDQEEFVKLIREVLDIER